MTKGDETGPHGEGKKTGRSLGLAAGNISGQTSNENRPFDGHGNGNGYRGIRVNYGSGVDNTKGYDPGQNTKTFDSKKQDTTGPPTSSSKRIGPGLGQMNESGLEYVINVDIEKYYIPNSNTYNVMSKEYASIYSQNKGNQTNTNNLKSEIVNAHNRAINKGYTGNKRREYVKREMSKYSKNNKSSKNTYKKRA